MMKLLLLLLLFSLGLLHSLCTLRKSVAAVAVAIAIVVVAAAAVDVFKDIRMLIML